MKTFIMGLTLILSTAAFANTCEEQVLTDYTKALAANDYHHLIGEVMNFKKFEKSFISYGTKVELGFDLDVAVYLAASEFMGGYGVEAIVVDPATCKTLKMVNVYAE